MGNIFKGTWKGGKDSSDSPNVSFLLILMIKMNIPEIKATSPVCLGVNTRDGESGKSAEHWKGG